MKVTVTIEDVTIEGLPMVQIGLAADAEQETLEMMEEPTPAMWTGATIIKMHHSGELTARTKAFIGSVEGIEGTAEAAEIQRRVESEKAAELAEGLSRVTARTEG